MPIPAVPIPTMPILTLLPLLLPPPIIPVAALSILYHLTIPNPIRSQQLAKNGTLLDVLKATQT